MIEYGKSIGDYLEDIDMIREKILKASQSENPEESFYSKGGAFSDIESLYINLHNKGLLERHIREGVGTPFDF
ncbi:MAG: hypothetical protein ABH804_01745 [archaeon]